MYVYCVFSICLSFQLTGNDDNDDWINNTVADYIQPNNEEVLDKVKDITQLYTERPPK